MGEKILAYIVAASCILLILSVTLVMLKFTFHDLNHDNQIVLNPDDWDCGKTQTYTEHVMVGKTIMPHIATHCVLYKRNK